MDNNDLIKRLKGIIEGSEKLVAFTGAGLSADSGIATYRGASGVWSKYDPAKYANIDYFREDPTYYWRFFKEVRYPMLKPAKPNKAHQVLAELEKKGVLFQVITQNIDGLHQIAGQTNVCELHGNTRQIVCLDCAKTFPMEEIYARLDNEMPPKCGCGGLLKPDVVLFGESLPQEALTKAWQAAGLCDTFLVVGSSLVVYPAAQIPVLAKENGAILVIINIDPTPLDHLADLVINQNASEVLAKILE
jgi:NAD-dependent deacetylase